MLLEFDEVTSTNTLAGEMLARGELSHGDAITARHQTQGRGRGAGRTWSDEAGASLLLSVVLTQIPEPAHLLQYRAALAVLSALRRLSKDHANGNDVRLKWPNDILLKGKKVSGLLIEAQWSGTTMRSAIVGIGVNVRQRSFPEEIAPMATSLMKEGIHATVEAVREEILNSIAAELHVSPVPHVLSRLQKELQWMTQLPSLEVIESGRHTMGLHFEGIEESGAARLSDENGNVIAVRAGSLSWDKPPNG